jgi:hypothetical protein
MASASGDNLRSKRVLQEFRHLEAEIAAGRLGFVKDLRMKDDDLFTWRFGLFNFDDSKPGGRNLNSDLNRLAAT